MTTIKLKNGSGAPLAGDLVQGEPALDLTNKRLYTEDSGGTVIEVGTNPTSLTTGTVTADTLDIDDLKILSGQSTTPTNDGSPLIYKTTSHSDYANGDLIIQARSSASRDIYMLTGTTTPVNRLQVNGNGNISFYEDTGATAKFFWDASAERLGIGTSSPDELLHLSDTGGNAVLKFTRDDTTTTSGSSVGTIQFAHTDADSAGVAATIVGKATNAFGKVALLFATGSPTTKTERMRLDAEGHLLVGTTNENPAANNVTGHALKAGGLAEHANSGAVVMRLNRTDSDGDMLQFYKGTSTVGSIGSSSGDLVIGNGDTGLYFWDTDDSVIPWNISTDSSRDATIDLGDGSHRFKDLYLSGASYASDVRSTGIQYFTHTTDARFRNSSGTERMRIDSSGRVGINRSNPAEKLHVDGGNVRVESDSYGNTGLLRLFGTDSIEKLQIGALSDTSAYIYTPSSTDLLTYTGGLERMRIDSSGNVGIGTSSPNADLELGGAGEVLRLSGSPTNAYIRNTDGTTNQWYIGSGGNAGLQHYVYQAEPITFHTSGSERMRIDSSGNVGIGESSPSYSLHVNAGNDNDIALFESTDSNAKVTLKDSTSSSAINSNNGNMVINCDANNEVADSFMAFRVDNDEKMRIDPNGVVSIGDTGSGSASRLYVQGASTNSNIGVARFNTTGDDESSSCIAIVKNSSSTSTNNVFIRFGVANFNSGCGQINANGTSQAAFGSFSDRRLKENITDLPNQLANITALRPVEFDYIESEGGGHQIGFIAQEVEEIYPDLVGERDDGMKTLTGINKIEARLIKAIQEQNELINDLRARVAQLESN